MSEQPSVPGEPLSPTDTPTVILEDKDTLFAWLVSLERASWGHLYPIPWTGISLGRTPENDIVVHDDTTSPIHARILITYDAGRPRCHIQDLASTYGTYVNGERIIRQSLSDNDHLTIGQTDFLFKQL